MHFTTSVATILAAASSASAIAIPSISNAGNSIVAYWGQGNVNIPLSDVCSNPNVDIVVLSFVNIFPDESASGWPGTNFGSSCGGQTISKPDGTATQLLDGAHCGTMIPDIAACQSDGKKVLLSLGGGGSNAWLHSDASATSFAQFLVGAFGAPSNIWTGPRPIGDSQVDGFDFDIESSFDVAPSFNGQSFPDAVSRGYATMANALHNLGYLTSAAPQCVRPDEHLDPALSSAWFDYVFVQFYNTDGCSAMDFIRGSSGFNFNAWASATYANENTKVYIGLPASTASANAGFYLTPTQVHTLLSSFTSTAHFGGVMLWEATASARNLICGNDYAWWIRKALDACYSGSTFSEICPSSSSSSSIASSTSSVASSTSSSSIIITFSSSLSIISSSSSSSISSLASSSSSSGISSSSSTWTSSSIPASPTITSSSSSSSDISSSSSTLSPTITSSASTLSSSIVSSSSYISSSSSSSESLSSSASSESLSSSSASSSESSSSSLSSSDISSSSTVSSSSSSSTESSSSIESSSSHLSTSSYPASSTYSTSSYSSLSSTPGSPVLPSTTSSSYDVTSSSSSYISFSYYPNSTYTPATSSTPGSPVLPSTTSSELYPTSKGYGYDEPSTKISTISSTSSVHYYDDASTTSSASSIHYYDGPSPSSNTPSKPTVTGKPHYSYDSPSSPSTSVYTTIITTTYIDICPTGLTTVTATYKTTVCPGSTTPAVPIGWTTTVTVCKNCGPKPTTITITKPYAASTTVEIVTLVVTPVPQTQKAYTTTLSTTVVVNNKASSIPAALPVKSMPAVPVPVKASPSHPVVAPGGGASSTSVKPVLASSSGYPIKAASASSSSPVSPIVQTYAAASGYAAAPTGRTTGSSPKVAQFTGAAGRVNVGVGAFVGLIIAVVALL